MLHNPSKANLLRWRHSPEGLFFFAWIAERREALIKAAMSKASSGTQPEADLLRAKSFDEINEHVASLINEH